MDAASASLRAPASPPARTLGDALRRRQVRHLNSLPQGEPERFDRAHDMVAQHDAAGFGGCSNHGECQAVCPQEISIKVIGELYADYRKAMVHRLRARRGSIKAQ